MRRRGKIMYQSDQFQSHVTSLHKHSHKKKMKYNTFRRDEFPLKNETERNEQL